MAFVRFAIALQSVSLASAIGDATCAVGDTCDGEQEEVMRVSLLQAKSSAAAEQAYNADLSRLQASYDERIGELQKEHTSAQEEAASKFVLASKAAEEDTDAGIKCKLPSIPQGWYCCSNAGMHNQPGYSLSCKQGWKCCLSPGDVFLSCLQECPGDQKDITSWQARSLLQASSVSGTAEEAYNGELADLQAVYEERLGELQKEHAAAQEEATLKFVAASKAVKEVEAEEGIKCKLPSIPHGWYCCSNAGMHNQPGYSLSCKNGWKCCLSPGDVFLSCLQSCPGDQKDITTWQR